MNSNPRSCSKLDLDTPLSSRSSLPPRSSGRHFSVNSGLQTQSAPFTTLTSAFYAQARWLWSSEIAVRDLSSNEKDREYTYRSLAEHAQAVSQHLVKQGIIRGQKIILVAKQGVESIVAILAILSCGAQFIPFDFELQSGDYLKRTLSCPGQNFVLSTSAESDSFLHKIFSNNPLAEPIPIIKLHANSDFPDLKQKSTFYDEASPTDTCYTVFKPDPSSGGPAAAKEIQIKHKNLTNLICLAPGNLGIHPGLLVGQVVNIVSEVAMWEIFGCLCNGGTLIIGKKQDERAFKEIEVLITTPTLLSTYKPEQLPKLTVLAAVGESIPEFLADEWAAHVPTIWKCYGSSEATMACAMSRHRTNRDSSFRRCKLGRLRSGCPLLNRTDGAACIRDPIPNSYLYVLDDKRQQRPIGLPGSIWVGGRGVVDDCGSYSSESYGPDPFVEKGSSMFCIGECAFCNEDGSMELIAPVPIEHFAKSGRDLPGVVLQRLTSALACTVGTSLVAVCALGMQVHCFIFEQDVQVETADQEAFSRFESMEEHLKILQQNGHVPTQIYIDQFHLLPKIPIGLDGNLDRATLRDKILRQELQNPPRLLQSVIEITPPTDSTDSVRMTRSVLSRRKQQYRSAVQDWLAVPVEMIRKFKRS